MHPVPFHLPADSDSAASLGHSGTNAEPASSEFLVRHPVAVAIDIFDALARCLGTVRTLSQGPIRLVQPTLDQLVPACVRLSLRELLAGTLERLGHVGDMAVGVTQVYDLLGDGVRLVGESPDPTGSVAQHYAPLRLHQAPPLRFPARAPCLLRRLSIRVAAGGALDRR